MSDTALLLDFLQQRNSSAKVETPGPGEEAVRDMIRAAIRVPDHAWLRPWRFISIEGERRRDFGLVLEKCLHQRDPTADQGARDKARNAPLRAPLVLVVVTAITAHPKVPAIEQRMSAGCAAHAILLAAEAQGFAGVWRTGDAAFDPAVMAALGLDGDEEIAGFLYLGSRCGRAKSLPDLDPEKFHSRW